MERKKENFKEHLKFVSTIISWTVFTLLIICSLLLIYYFLSTKIYALKGEKYEPRFSLYTIISPSMVPNIEVYDVIVNFRVDSPEDVKIGDVITFISQSAETNGDTVTHRVVSIIQDDEGNFSYQTKGDNNLIADSASVPYSNIIGRVGLKIPQLGRVQFFVASKFGWLFLILIPAVYILLKALLRSLKQLYPDAKIFNLGNNRFFKFMNKPLIGWRKRKLLPEPKIMVETAPEMTTPIIEPIPSVGKKEPQTISINDMFPRMESDVKNDLPEIKPDITPSAKETVSINDLYKSDEDDIDFDDLPKLK